MRAKQIFEKDSTQTLLALSLIITAVGVGMAFTLAGVLASPQSHGSASRTGFVTPAPRADPLTASIGNGPKTTGGTELVHGTLSGSVKPAQDQAWRHWLQ
jgi:hypothetical protein